MGGEVETGFHAKFWGRFTGVLRWSDLDGLWERVCAHPDGWYIYSVPDGPPATPASSEGLLAFVEEVGRKLRQDHPHDYCGIVYADSLEMPTLVKIYHPGHLGAACGSSGSRILPRWVLSRTLPSALIIPPDRDPGRRAWWRRIMGND